MTPQVRPAHYRSAHRRNDNRAYRGRRRDPAEHRIRRRLPSAAGVVFGLCVVVAMWAIVDRVTEPPTGRVPPRSPSAPPVNPAGVGGYDRFGPANSVPAGTGPETGLKSPQSQDPIGGSLPYPPTPREPGAAGLAGAPMPSPTGTEPARPLGPAPPDEPDPAEQPEEEPTPEPGCTTPTPTEKSHRKPPRRRAQ